MSTTDEVTLHATTVQRGHLRATGRQHHRVIITGGVTTQVILFVHDAEVSTSGARQVDMDNVAHQKAWEAFAGRLRAIVEGPTPQETVRQIRSVAGMASR